MPTEEQIRWLAAIFASPPSALDGAPGGVADDDWAAKFEAAEAKSEAEYRKIYDAALRAIDEARLADEKEQREPHPSRPMTFRPRSGLLKTPEEVPDIELLEDQNHLVLQLRIFILPESHQLSVSLFNCHNESREEAHWTFDATGAQTVKAVLFPGIYELVFASEKLPDRSGAGRPIECFYSLALEPQRAKPKPAPRRRR